MKKLLFALIFFFSASYLFAQIPNGYYTNAQNKKGYALRSALFNIIKNHTVVSYAGLWTAFQTTDVKPNGKVWDMYSDTPDQTPPYEFTFGSNQCGNYSGEGDCYNREHSVPASWFNDASPMYSDLFHLVPTDGYVNNRRSNYPFGDVGSASWTSQNGSKLGSSSVSGYSGTVFEPIDDYKGDFARALFYMSVCYMDKNLGQTTTSMYTNGSLDSWAIAMLIQWHTLDPVSQKEINRNNAVYDEQGNRNPFIDYPELVGKIYGADSVNLFLPTSIQESENITPRITFTNPTTTALNLYYNLDLIEYQNITLDVYDLLGHKLKSIDVTSQPSQVDVSEFPKGVYIIQFVYLDEKRASKLIIQ